MAWSVACAQFAPRKADVPSNLDRIAELVIQASGEGAELVVFPEAATSGYFLEGGVLECALSGEELRDGLCARLKGQLNKPVDALVGFYQSEGGNLYNSAAYLEFGAADSALRHVYKKFFLPTYGVFDEERFVSRGREIAVFDTRLGKLGVLICEDIWHSILPTLAAVAGAQVLLVPSASPARGFSGAQIGNLEHYERMMGSISEEHGVYCVNCQLTGFEGGKGLSGGSSVSDPKGKIIARGPNGEEFLLLASIDLDQITIARAGLPLISDLQSAWEDIRKLVCEIY